MRKWLQGTVKGRLILHTYKTHDKLTPVSQKHLMDEILNKVFESKWNFGNHTSSKIATKIVEMFPNEPYDIYYLPPKSTGENQTHSKGLIPNKLRNSQRFFKTLEKQRVNKADNKSVFDEVVNGKAYTKLKEIVKIHELNVVYLLDLLSHNSPEIDEQMAWLTLNSTPWEEVVKCWKSTTLKRTHENKSKTLSEIYNHWQILHKSNGIYLVRAISLFLIFLN